MENWMGMIEVVNRVSRPLTITFDGKTITLPPLGKVYVPPIVADKGVQQNPILGTEDPYNPRVFRSLLGVPSWNMDCSPLVAESSAEERIDRSLLPPDARKATKLRADKERPVPMPGVVDGGDVHFDGR